MCPQQAPCGSPAESSPTALPALFRVLELRGASPIADTLREQVLRGAEALLTRSRPFVLQTRRQLAPLPSTMTRTSLTTTARHTSPRGERLARLPLLVPGQRPRGTTLHMRGRVVSQGPFQVSGLGTSPLHACFARCRAGTTQTHVLQTISHGKAFPPCFCQLCTALLSQRASGLTAPSLLPLPMQPRFWQGHLEQPHMPHSPRHCHHPSKRRRRKAPTRTHLRNTQTRRRSIQIHPPNTRTHPRSTRTHPRSIQWHTRVPRQRRALLST